MSGSSVSFYVLGLMRQAVCDSVTGGAAGFPKENVMDFNPDTYWKAPNLTNHSFDIDLQSAKQLNGIIILLNNYTFDFSPQNLFAQSSPDDIVYTTRTNATFDNDLTQQIYIREFTFTERYWRIGYSNSPGPTPTEPKWSGILLFRKYTIAQAAQWPEQDIDRYHSRVITSVGGRQFVQSINFNTQEILTRKYRLNLTDMNTLKTVFNDCKGRVFPLILQEGTSNTDARFVRFASDSLNENQLDFELFEPTVQFVEIPFIPDGEVY